MKKKKAHGFTLGHIAAMSLLLVAVMQIGTTAATGRHLRADLSGIFSFFNQFGRGATQNVIVPAQTQEQDIAPATNMTSAIQTCMDLFGAGMDPCVEVVGKVVETLDSVSAYQECDPALMQILSQYNSLQMEELFQYLDDLETTGADSVELPLQGQVGNQNTACHVRFRPNPQDLLTGCRPMLGQAEGCDDGASCSFSFLQYNRPPPNGPLVGACACVRSANLDQVRRCGSIIMHNDQRGVECGKRKHNDTGGCGPESGTGNGCNAPNAERCIREGNTNNCSCVDIPCASRVSPNCGLGSDPNASTQGIAPPGSGTGCPANQICRAPQIGLTAPPCTCQPYGG